MAIEFSKEYPVEFDNIATEFLLHEQMKETGDYVSRGRLHEGLSESELNERWIHYFRPFATGENVKYTKEMDDVTAELSLRGMEPPLDRVPEECAALVGRFNALGLDTLKGSPEVRAKLAAFMAERARPKI